MSGDEKGAVGALVERIDVRRCRLMSLLSIQLFQQSCCPGLLGHTAERRPSGDVRVRNRLRSLTEYVLSGILL